MTQWTVKGLGGWMMVVEADTEAEAWRIGRSNADSASLLPSDISRPVPATQEDIDWVEAMSGPVTPKNPYNIVVENSKAKDASTTWYFYCQESGADNPWNSNGFALQGAFFGNGDTPRVALEEAIQAGRDDFARYESFCAERDITGDNLTAILVASEINVSFDFPAATVS